MLVIVTMAMTMVMSGCANHYAATGIFAVGMVAGAATDHYLEKGKWAKKEATLNAEHATAILAKDEEIAELKAREQELAMKLVNAETKLANATAEYVKSCDAMRKELAGLRARIDELEKPKPVVAQAPQPAPPAPAPPAPAKQCDCCHGSSHDNKNSDSFGIGAALESANRTAREASAIARSLADTSMVIKTGTPAVIGAYSELLEKAAAVGIRP